MLMRNWSGMEGINLVSGQGYEIFGGLVIRGLVRVVRDVRVTFFAACGIFISMMRAVKKNIFKSIYDHPDPPDRTSKFNGFSVMDRDGMSGILICWVLPGINAMRVIRTAVFLSFLMFMALNLWLINSSK